MGIQRRVSQAPSKVRYRIFCVAPDSHDADGWVVSEAGSKRSLGWYLSLQVGLDAACRMAKEHPPSRVILQSTDGRIATTYTFDPD